MPNEEMIQDLASILESNYLTVFFGLTSVVLALYAIHITRKKKEISFDAVRSEVVSPDGSYSKNEIEILFHGVRVPSVEKSLIMMWNSGNSLIEEQDIPKDSPIRIKFDEGASILKSKILKESRPESQMRLSINNESNHIIDISFDYLNQNEGCLIEVLHTPSERMMVEGSIKGFPNNIKTPKYIDVHKQNQLDFYKKIYIISRRIMHVAFALSLALLAFTILVDRPEQLKELFNSSADRGADGPANSNVRFVLMGLAAFLVAFCGWFYWRTRPTGPRHLDPDT